MSYITQHLRLKSTRLGILAMASLATACGGSDSSDGSLPDLEVTTTVTDPVELVDPAGLKAAIAERPGMPLINVHIPYEDHIDGTDQFIAFDSILDSPDLPTDKTAPIALYCRSGNMSAQAAATLAEAGYTDVLDLEGGMNAWEATGNSLVDDPSVAE